MSQYKKHSYEVIIRSNNMNSWDGRKAGRVVYFDSLSDAKTFVRSEVKRTQTLNVQFANGNRFHMVRIFRYCPLHKITSTLLKRITYRTPVKYAMGYSDYTYTLDGESLHISFPVFSIAIVANY